MNAEAKKRYKEVEFPFTCPITNRIFDSSKGLSVYLTKTLKINHSDYYDKYINHRDSKCFFCGSKGVFISVSKGYRNLCNDSLCIKKSFNSHSIEGIMYRKMIEREEAEKEFEIQNKKQLENRINSQNELRKKDPLWDKKRSRNCKEFWIEKGYSEKEAEDKVKLVMDEIHQKTFKKFKENPQKYASKNPTKIEYYLKKGYSEEIAKKLLSERQRTFSKERCIEKYGESEGIKIWLKRQEKWLNTLNQKTEDEKIEINKKKLFNNNGYSKVSQFLFWSVYEEFKDNDVRFQELNEEVITYDKQNKKHYKYDYVDFTLKKIIEFNGDYWHCNPSKFQKDFLHPIMNVKASQIWEKDSHKNRLMEQKGYEILVIWESDYRKNPKETLRMCLDFLNV